MEPAHRKSFWALIVTQFCGAFNDNLLKILVTLIIIELVQEPERRSALVNLASAVFVAPFLMFSMIAGRVSDRVGKPRVIFGTQIYQIVLVPLAVYSLLSMEIFWLLVSLFFLAKQSAFFSPAKYGILPELMNEHELSHGNGLINMATFMAILSGTIAGSLTSTRLGIACMLLSAAGIVGIAASRSIAPLPAANPGEPWAWNPFGDLWANWTLIAKDKVLKWGIIAVNYFWFMGALLQLVIFLYAKEMMNATPQQSGLLMISVTLGIASGSYAAGRLSRERIDLRWVPLGAVGMSVFVIDLFWAHTSFARTLADLFVMGASGGLYCVPLNAMIQWRSPSGERARILATQNFVSFLAILWASAALWILSNVFHLNPAQVFLAIGLFSVKLMAGLLIFAPSLRRTLLPIK